jgi:hypothetical protein
MTDQEVVERGIRAEHLLKDETFQLVVDDLVKLLSDMFLTSKPEEQDKRQNVYFAYQGVNDVVSLLNQMVAARLEVEARLNEAEQNY